MRKGEKEKGWRRKGGQETEGMGGTGQDRTWDGRGGMGKEEGEGKGRQGLQPPNFQFLAPPL